MNTLLSVIDVAGLVLFVLYIVQQIVSALMPRPRPAVAGPESGVGITFLIPALNEQDVLADTLENLRAVVPDARVVVIDDASDDATPQIVAAHARRDPGVLHLRREFPEARQNKGKAMNWAVGRLLTLEPWASADLTREVFVVMDADGRVGEDFAPQVRGAFLNPDVMAAQGWMRFRHTGIPRGRGGVLAHMLLFQQDLETFITGHIQRARAWGGAASLTGNGQCMRVSYLDSQLRAGTPPWPDVLLEDFASAVQIRLADPRYRIALLTARVGQQGLLDLPSLIKQRSRWTQGAMQCLPYLRGLWTRSMNPVVRLDFSYFVLAPWLNLILIVSIVSQPLRRIFGWQGLMLPGWVGLLLTVLPLAMQLNWALRYRLDRHLGWWSVPYTLASLPAYSAALLASLPRAYRNFFTGQNAWYKSERHAEGTAPAPSVREDETAEATRELSRRP